MKIKILYLVIIHILQLRLFLQLAFGLDTLYPGHSISDGQKLTSRNKMFELGFYDYDYYSHYYSSVGIWYKKLPNQTIVWVAHNDQNFQPTQLLLSLNGDLELLYDGATQMSFILYASNSKADFNATRLVLEDSGNLVLRGISDPTNVLWQSFDHPRDTWLPGAKIGFNSVDQVRQVYRSHWFDGDSTRGNFSAELDPVTKRTIILKKDGTMYGTCRFKGVSMSCSLESDWYTGEADILLSESTRISYVSTKKETYFTYTLTNTSIRTRLVLDNTSGLFIQLVWSKDSQTWISSVMRLSDTYCDKFALYNPKRQHHECSLAIIPASWSSFQCHSGQKEGFLLIHNRTILLTPPQTSQKNILECKATCLANCNCAAYAYSSVCMTWDENSLSLQNSPGNDIYVRLATINTRKGKRKTTLKKVGTVTGGTILGLALMLTLIWKFKKYLPTSQANNDFFTVMSYNDLQRATKDFTNKIGEGGFGSVYKGSLPNSSDIKIAVKQLKVNSQAEKQFRAEVTTLGTIHHVNLVCLKGFCVKGTKRYLVYDYMPNGSLEKYLFGDGHFILEWKTRYQIALGVAKGLAYLHEECRECIIHCDIKPENILLDVQFKPKIADFGLAKLLGRDFSRVLTTMRGTRGYLAPEWALGIAITSKADVYSYGMMLFEIISGKRNWCIRLNGENDYTPLEVMEKLTSDGDLMNLLDAKLEGNANVEELIRVCRVACWCIQEDERNRLSMVHIVQILEGVLETVTPPMPRFLQYIADITEESQYE